MSWQCREGLYPNLSFWRAKFENQEIVHPSPFGFRWLLAACCRLATTIPFETKSETPRMKPASSNTLEVRPWNECQFHTDLRAVDLTPQADTCYAFTGGSDETLQGQIIPQLVRPTWGQSSASARPRWCVHTEWLDVKGNGKRSFALANCVQQCLSESVFSHTVLL